MTKIIRKKAQDLTLRELYIICNKCEDCEQNCTLCSEDICHGTYSPLEVATNAIESDSYITFEINNSIDKENQNDEVCARKNYTWYFKDEEPKRLSLTNDQVKLFDYITNCIGIGTLDETLFKEI